MSTIMSPPANGRSAEPLIQAGGGDATSDIPAHQFYLSSAFQDHLQRVYNELCEGKPTLDQDKFVSWLENVQGQSTKAMRRETYTFQEFLEAVYINQGFELARPPSTEKDLSKPISNYFISSSHNTYLSGNQLSSKSSTESYKNVLIRGCRCIEIDVFDGEAVDSITSTPSTTSSPKPEHKIQFTASTISSLFAETTEKLESKYKNTKDAIKDGLGLNIIHGNGNRSSDSFAVVEPLEQSVSTKSARKGEPLVLHGWTLTAPVGFRDVCKCIKETAFLTSNLPIIVSLEVHANLEQQELMVSIMKEEWKGLLIDEAHASCDPEERLPRLDELLNKILIKVKKANPSSPEMRSGNNLSSSHSPKASSSSLTPKSSRHLSASNISLTHVNSRQEAEGCSGSEDERSSKKKAKICEALSNLGIYTHSEPFFGFDAKNCLKPSHIFSISENQILDLNEKKGAEMFAHNRNFFMRAYPSGLRFDSSNLDPAPFWRKGVQMAALNWQNVDEGVMLNEAMFAGEQGWALKPPGYRSDPSGTETIQYKTLHLKVTVYAGQHIPIPENQTEEGFRPYIKCQLHVENSDDNPAADPFEGSGKAKSGELKQRAPHGHGDHPDFGEEGVVLDFPVVTGVVEELSFVRFKIEDPRIYVADSLAAWACIRLDRLQQGYRFLKLLDAKGIATEGMLLIKVEKTIS